MATHQKHGDGNDDMPLPQIRQDVELLEGWPEYNGSPTWMLFDPLRNHYFRVGHSVFQLLSLWTNATLKGVQSLAKIRLKRDVGEDEIGDLVKFLFVNQLTHDPPAGGYKGFVERERAGKKGWLAKALHNYLFFRIPIFKPAKFLNWSWPVVAPLFSKASAVSLAFLGVLSLYLLSRQWASFEGQFIAFLSFEGAFYFGTSLVLVKIIHELGHAWMTTRYKLEVPVIGIAFLVLMPVLYTDTSNAWRLRSRRQRLMIDGAGIFVELAIAVLATLFWVFLPDGPLRAVMFSVATVSWVMSLLINLNPFMRFDGYYILSDLLGFENMQARGFALAKWRMREVLFGLGLPPPEVLPRWLSGVVVFHAWGTWIYRFFLFLGIAILVYTFFIKVLAILLFVVEIFWFIALPVWRELKEWWSMRHAISKCTRAHRTFLVFAAAAAVLFIPFSSGVSVPAVMHASNEALLYPPMPAKLEELHVKQEMMVKSGDILAKFSSDQLNLDIDLTKNRIDLLKRRLARGVADARDKSERAVLKSQLDTEQDALKGHEKRRSELVLRAPISGDVVDLSPQVHINRTFPRDFALFGIRNNASLRFSGLVAEDQLDRLAVGFSGKFVPDNPQYPSTIVAITGLGKTAIARFRDAELAQTHGGPVPAKLSEKQSNGPVGSFYQVTMVPQNSNSLSREQTMRGIAVIAGERRSFAGRVARRIASVLIRESGF